MATQRLVGPGSPLALTQPRGGGCGGAVPPLPRGWKGSISPQNCTRHGHVLPFPVPGWLLAALMGCLQLSTGALGTAVAVSRSMGRAAGKLPGGCARDGARGTQGPRLPWHRVQGTDRFMCMPWWTRGDQGNQDRARAGHQRDTAGHGPTTSHVSLARDPVPRGRQARDKAGTARATCSLPAQELRPG